jgi:tight adherence protein B
MIKVTISLLFALATGMFIWYLWPHLRRRYETHKRELDAAVFRLTPRPFDPRPWIIAWYALMLACVVAALPIFSTPWPGLLAASALSILPRIVSRVWWARRRRTIEHQIPAAIELLTGSLGAGMTLPQALAHTSRTAPEPIRSEFCVMINRYRSGADLPATIEAARRRLAMGNFTLLASALLMSRDTGGNVSRTLDRAARAIEKLEEMQQKVLAATSGGRSTVRLLAVTPVFFLGMTYCMDAEGLRLMFTSKVGWFTLAAAGALMVGGLFWAWKLSHPDV